MPEVAIEPIHAVITIIKEKVVRVRVPSIALVRRRTPIEAVRANTAGRRPRAIARSR